MPPIHYKGHTQLIKPGHLSKCPDANDWCGPTGRSQHLERLVTFLKLTRFVNTINN